MNIIHKYEFTKFISALKGIYCPVSIHCKYLCKAGFQECNDRPIYQATTRHRDPRKRVLKKPNVPLLSTSTRAVILCVQGSRRTMLFLVLAA